MNLDNKKTQKNPFRYVCSKCAFNSHHNNDYNRHLLTAKHKRITEDNKKTQSSLSNFFTCICGKNYKNIEGLSKHKTKCSFQEKLVNNIQNAELTIGPVINASLVMEIIKENQEFKNLLVLQQQQMMEFQNQIIEISKEPKITNNTTNNTTNNNTQFNIQLFLNETCKNAPNFSEFIDNIQISTNDLENNVKFGFVNGISKLIMNNLKQMELYERPIHCTDAKREIIYVKEEDRWEKDESKDIIHKGIQEITRKNMCHLSEWREENPEYEDIESVLGEQSIMMQQHSMAGGKRSEFYPKIIKRIAKETILDKK